MNWFEVDRAGLAKLLERRGKAFAVFEILSNAWDTNAKKVTVEFNPIPGVPKADLRVDDDDPEGFKDLSHSFTLFAESEKKSKSETRGRFNLGEKLVLAICDEATIFSTKGGVRFDKEGRHTLKKVRANGSNIMMTLRMTRAEYDEALAAIKTLIPPGTCETIVNGEKLARPKWIHTLEVELPTEVADADGNLKRSRRKTKVAIYDPRPGEKATLYELGVPVVETGDRWHLDVQQKVPLNMDRDNVPPSFLREIRTATVNQLFGLLTKDDANQPWVREATSDDDCSPQATETVMTLRFGEKRVAYDPSDPEANKLAVSKGYTVVHGGMMNATEWANAKEAESILPAGKVTPSPKPFVEGGEKLKMVEPADYTPGMKRVAAYAKALSQELLHRSLSVRIANDMTWGFNGTFGSGTLIMNVGRLGHSFFDDSIGESVNRFLIHEFGHHYSGDHLSSEYHAALCLLGAQLTQLALTNPDFFKEFSS